MSRRSLRPQLNQIRGWVRQGRTDAWIAHQLEVTVQQIQSFKRENELELGGDGAGDPGAGDEVDLRAEDDAAIAAELEAEEARRVEEEARGRAPAEEEAKAARRRRRRPSRRRPRPARRRRGAGAGEATPRRRARAAAQAHRPARGHVRPRRGGLRALARSRGPGRSRLRRALGRPPAGRGHDRGGPDRDPARRRRRGRRRLTSIASSRTCARSRRGRGDGRSAFAHGTAVFRPGIPLVARRTWCASRRAPPSRSRS